MAMVLGSAVLAIAQIVVCPKCGFECQSGSAKCTQCETPLSGKAPSVEPIPGDDKPESADKGASFAPGGKLQYLGLEVLKQEVQSGRKFVDSGNLDLARLFFRNALALDRLARADPDGKRVETLRKNIKQCERWSQAVRQDCPVCGDSPKPRMKVASVTGEVRYQDIGKKICPRCTGSKFIVKPMTVAQWKERGAKAAKQFESLQAERQFANAAGVWVPRDIEAKLTMVQRAAMRKALGLPCGTCSGAGQTDCDKCSGLGEIRCAGQGCEMGLITVETGGQLMKGKLIRTENCPVCNGTGAVNCPDCKGAGKDACRKCGGTGLAPACRKCSGEGLIECRKCKGAGSVKDQPCAECGGEGKVMCPTCSSAKQD